MIKISLVIPVAPGRKVDVLESIKKLDYPKKNYEVIIEQSTEKGPTASLNRNRGAKRAKGEIIGFLDDDAFINKDLLKNVVAFFAKHPQIDLVGGPQLTPPSDSFFAKTSGYALSSFFGAYTMRSRYIKTELNLNADEMSLTSANFFVKKKSFEKTGEFNTVLYPGEDPEFFNRAKLKGMKIAYSPDLIIYHKRRPTYYSFCKQIFKYGYVRLLVGKINKTKSNPVFLVPSIFVVYLVLLPFLIYFDFLFLLPLSAYVVIAFLASLIIAVKKDFLALPLLIFLFFSLHVSYGLGMLYYLIKNPKK